MNKFWFDIFILRHAKLIYIYIYIYVTCFNLDSIKLSQRRIENHNTHLRKCILWKLWTAFSFESFHKLHRLECFIGSKYVLVLVSVLYLLLLLILFYCIVWYIVIFISIVIIINSFVTCFITDEIKLSQRRIENYDKRLRWCVLWNLLTTCTC